MKVTAASVSDLAVLVPSWRLSLEAENKSPRTIASFLDATVLRDQIPPDELAEEEDDRTPHRSANSSASEAGATPHTSGTVNMESGVAAVSSERKGRD